MFYKKIAVVFILLLSFLFFNHPFVSAETEDKTESGDTVSLENPIGEGEEGVTSPEIIIGNVINAVLGIVGSLALLMFIYGGLVWMTSSGNSEKVQKGKNILIWATLGLVVIFASYALVNFVITDVINPSGGGGGGN